MNLSDNKGSPRRLCGDCKKTECLIGKHSVFYFIIQKPKTPNRSVTELIMYSNSVKRTFQLHFRKQQIMI